VKPVQIGSYCRCGKGQIPDAVHMRAYEVYKRLYGEQESLIEGECRGGFGSNELVAFLYASGFPQSEWRQRVDEAMDGMKLH
jgi:hypothetical protein